MKKTSKARQYLLPHTTTYSIVDYSYLSMENGGGHICENCGKIITNIVTVKDQNNKTYLIGVDCAKTLTSLHERDIKSVETKIGALKRFYKKLSDLVKYGYEVVIKDDKSRYLIYTVRRTDFMGNTYKKPHYVYEMQQIEKSKAHLPTIEKYIGEVESPF